MTIGLSNGTSNNISVWQNEAGEIYGMGNDENINVPIGTTRKIGTINTAKLIGITTDGTKSGMILDTSSLLKTIIKY